MPSGHVEAKVDGTIIASSDTYELVEGNVYFPPSSVKSEYLTKTDLHTHCPWKGDASYYSLKVGGAFLTPGLPIFPSLYLPSSFLVPIYLAVPLDMYGHSLHMNITIVYVGLIFT